MNVLIHYRSEIMTGQYIRIMETTLIKNSCYENQIKFMGKVGQIET